MKYKFSCDIRPKDLWYLYMYRMYTSVAGMITLIFGISMIVLTVTFWSRNGVLMRTGLVVLSLLVPVVQPLGVYLRSMKELEQLPKQMELWFSDKGIYIQVEEKSDHVSWNKVGRIMKEVNMVMIVLKDGRGYMISDRVLGKDKEDFCRYAASCIS